MTTSTVFAEARPTTSQHSDDLWDEDVKVHEVGYLTDLLGNHAVNVIDGYAKAGKALSVEPAL